CGALAPGPGDRLDVGQRAPDAALLLDHLLAGSANLRVEAGDRVGDIVAVEPAVVGFAQRRMDANVGGDAGQDHGVDAATAQDALQIRAAKGAVAGLVDDDLPGHRCELVDDVVPVLAADEQAAHRTARADLAARVAASLQLGR